MLLKASTLHPRKSPSSTDPICQPAARLLTAADWPRPIPTIRERFTSTSDLGTSSTTSTQRNSRYSPTRLRAGPASALHCSHAQHLSSRRCREVTRCCYGPSMQRKSSPQVLKCPQTAYPISKGFWKADIEIQALKGLNHHCNQGRATKQGSSH